VLEREQAQFKCNTYMALVGARACHLNSARLVRLIRDEFKEISPYDPMSR
jgi:hypothetical protein